MSVTDTPTGFSLEAFLTRIIPGLIFLSPVLISLGVANSSIFENGYLSFIVVGVAALILGEVIEHIRSGLLRVPLPFSNYLYVEPNDDSFLPSWYRYVIKFDRRLPNRLAIVKQPDEENKLGARLQFNMLEAMEDEFELDREKARARDFFDALILYLGSNINPRTKEYRNAYIFNKNLKLSTVIAMSFYVYQIYLQYPSGRWLVFAASAVAILVVVFFLLSFLTASSNVYVEMLEKEFYMRLIE